MCGGVCKSPGASSRKAGWFLPLQDPGPMKNVRRCGTAGFCLGEISSWHPTHLNGWGNEGSEEMQLAPSCRASRRGSLDLNLALLPLEFISFKILFLKPYHSLWNLEQKRHSGSSIRGSTPSVGRGFGVVLGRSCFLGIQPPSAPSPHFDLGSAKLRTALEVWELISCCSGEEGPGLGLTKANSQRPL